MILLLFHNKSGLDPSKMLTCTKKGDQKVRGKVLLNCIAFMDFD